MDIMAMMTKNTTGVKPVVTQPMKPHSGPKQPTKAVSSKGDKPVFTGEAPPFIDPADLPLLERHLKSPPKTMEVEVSFGLFNTKNLPEGRRTFFEPGVSVSQFNNLLHYLSSLFHTGIWSSKTPIPELEVTVEESENRKDGPRVKKIIDALGSVTWLEKQRHTKETIDNETWGYRISKSTEKINENGPENFTPNFWRRKERRTFFVVSKDSDFYGVQFDLTIVRETKEKFDHKSKTSRLCTDLKYEVEIERKATIEPSVFEKAIEMVTSVIQHAFDRSQLLTMPQRELTIQEHNKLFQKDEHSRDSDFCKDKNYDPGSFYLRSNYWNKPENIKVDDMLNPENKFSITLKVDGVRRFLFVARGGIFSCSPPRDMWKIGGAVPELTGTLLDTEAYIDNSGQTTYYVFDILFFRGQDVRGEYFSDDVHKGRPGRLSILKDVCPKLKFFKGEIAQPKNFYSGPNFYENVGKAFEEAAILEEQGVRLDGLIAQSHVWYKNFFTRKWKPSDMLTTDFKFAKVAGSEEDFLLQVKTPTGYEAFSGSRRNPFKGQPIVSLPDGILEGIENSGGLILNPPANGIVVECRWDSENEVFVPVRYRDDKEEPNFIKVAADVWDDIVDPISKEDIAGESLFAMRRFHNLIKKHFLIKEFKKGDVIMDWGSGRGGDIAKWKEIGIDTVFVVEPNETNFTEFERRLNSMQEDWKGQGPKVVPIEEKPGQDEYSLVGAENTKVILKTIGSGNLLDGIVSFFSLTFFGRDKEMFDKMIETIDKTLPVGGKFLGIVMDGDRVQKLLEQDEEAAEGESLMFDCPAFKITQLSAFDPGKVKKDRNEIEITIKEATSMVDQNEWLFYFSALKTSLEKIGFELKYDGFLDEKGSPLLNLPQKQSKKPKKEKGPVQLFNVLNNDGKTFSSLNRYFMFERVSRDGSKKKPVKDQSPSSPVYTKKTPAAFKIDEHLDIQFDFLKSYWEEKIPETEKERDFFLVRPVPQKIKYSFIHSVLYAIDSKYRALKTVNERVDRVYSVLRMMATKMSFELYCQVMKGETYDLFGGIVKRPEFWDDEDKLEMECAEFRLKLLDGTELSSDIYAGILSHLLKINIMKIEILRDDLILDSERGIFGCFENTIVILKTYPEQHDVLADAKNKKVFMAYPTKSAFIRRMIEHIAVTKKNRGARFKMLL